MANFDELRIWLPWFAKVGVLSPVIVLLAILDYSIELVELVTPARMPTSGMCAIAAWLLLSWMICSRMGLVAAVDSSGSTYLVRLEAMIMNPTLDVSISCRLTSLRSLIPAMFKLVCLTCICFVCSVLRLCAIVLMYPRCAVFVAVTVKLYTQ